MLILTLVLIALAVGTWQAIHRTSPLVRRWHPSSFPRRAAGPLSVLDSGPTDVLDEGTVVFLHGLGTTGDYFGAFYDGLSRRRRVVIVDLLGFGHSLDEERSDFGLEDHVDALDEALDALGLGESTIAIAAHSMSTAVALTWAGRNTARTEHVYLWGPPIYPGESAAEEVTKEYGIMGRLFAIDTKWAERACRVNCANREVSAAFFALAAPRWPKGISGDAGRHTWESYQGSLRDLVLDVDWASMLPIDAPVTVFRGADDPIGDRTYIADLLSDAEFVTVPDADHHVALQRPELLFDALGLRL